MFAADGASPHFYRRVTVERGFDHRDEPGGIAQPMTIVFELHGPRATVRWGLETGWFHRPFVGSPTPPDSLWRRNHPGPDFDEGNGGPHALAVSLTMSDGEHADEPIPVPHYQGLLIEQLFALGENAVLDTLENIYVMSVADD